LFRRTHLLFRRTHLLFRRTHLLFRRTHLLFRRTHLLFRRLHNEPYKTTRRVETYAGHTCVYTIGADKENNQYPIPNTQCPILLYQMLRSKRSYAAGFTTPLKARRPTLGEAAP
ncbi:MAG: hypothetical protein V7K21_27575, partial [Nostoc sp.]|uniref:hypothetical protein n=1 Tax=Nostoc sp. TaxID=1180 RepID=UPI002FF81A62